MPEVSHDLDSIAIGVTSDRGAISHKPHVEALPAVERLKDHGRSAALGELTELVQFLAEIVAGLHRVGHARLLTIESGNHDDTGGAELSGGLDDLTHGRVELVLDSWILSEDESVETSANG